MRNKVNSLVDKAKSDFITRKLDQNSRNPKKFWQSINDLIKDKVEVDICNIDFINPATGLVVDKDNTPDFLNNYFANIGEFTRGPDADIDIDIQSDVSVNGLPGFDFAPVTIECFYRFIGEIDIDMSSCIYGLNMNICRLCCLNLVILQTRVTGGQFHRHVFLLKF